MNKIATQHNPTMEPPPTSLLDIFSITQIPKSQPKHVFQKTFQWKQLTSSFVIRSYHVLSIVLATSWADAQVPFHSSSFHYEHLDNLRVSWKWWSSSYFCQSLQLKINHQKKVEEKQQTSGTPPGTPRKKMGCITCRRSRLWDMASSKQRSVVDPFQQLFCWNPTNPFGKKMGPNGSGWDRYEFLKKGSMKYILPPPSTLWCHLGALCGGVGTHSETSIRELRKFSRSFTPPQISVVFGNTFQQSSYIVRSLPHLSCQISYHSKIADFPPSNARSSATAMGFPSRLNACNTKTQVTSRCCMPK